MANDLKENAAGVEEADIAVAKALKPVAESKSVKTVAKAGKVADQPPLIILSAAITAAGLLSRNRRLFDAGVRMLAAHALATGLKNVVKNRVDRTRPQLLDEGEYRMEAGESEDKELRSFPSGHAAGIAAVARAAAREYRVGPAALLVTSALSAAQVLRRAHFPSDVLAGVAIGLAAEAISGRALRPLLSNRAARSG